ncbi:MAG: glycerol-3-phosphate dehydrogenase/oxidase, partial [bacterium]
EKRDFAYGTSSRSSKLIHGGLRYLKYLHIKLVRESLREREILLNIAPHLVHPAHFLLPVYKGRRDKKFEINVGLIGYDLMAGSKKLEHHKMLSKEDIIERVPFLEQQHLNGGFIYPDCVVDDARLTLATIISAAEYGAVVANYAEVIDFKIESNSITNARFRDNITNSIGLISGKIFVNATGPWTDNLRKLLGDLSPILRPTKGIHIVLHREKMPVNHVVVIATADERMIFVVPHGDYTYIGTTDTDYDGDYDQVFADEDDVNYLIDATNREFSGIKINKKDVISTWAGLRPLIYEEGSTTEISRDYDIIISPNNLVTITGGKLTTYRHMAEVLIDRILKQFTNRFDREFEDCRTQKTPLHGGEFNDYQSFLASVQKGIGKQWRLHPKIIQRLLVNYGSHYLKILGYGLQDKSLLNRLCPGSNVLQAEVCYAIEEEMTLRLIDFMINRTHLNIFNKTNGRDALRGIAEIMRNSFDWSEQEYQEQIEEYLEFVEKTNFAYS